MLGVLLTFTRGWYSWYIVREPVNRMEWSTRGGGLTEIVTEASWREIGKVLQTSYSGRGKDSPRKVNQHLNFAG